jgi:hypothetical protein
MDLLAERAAGTLPRGGSEAMVRRRRVVYVEGYDPQGAKGYHRLFLREWRRFLTVWPLQASVGDLVIESEAFAHWRLSAAAPGWKVETQYDFLRLEHVIRPWMAAPTWAHLWRSLRWIADDLASLTFFRIFRASWRFGLHLLYPQLFILAWIAASVLAGADRRHGGRIPCRPRHPQGRRPRVRHPDQRRVAASARVRTRAADWVRRRGRSRRTAHRRRCAR